MRQTRGFGREALRAPVVDMIEPSDSTRSGASIASVWAIMPPIEAPTTCVRSIPRWSSRPSVSAAMSSSRYGASRRRPAKPRSRFGTGASIWVERPASRLSKRITRKPRPASVSQSARSQWISCMPRPITSSSGGSAGSPIVS